MIIRIEQEDFCGEEYCHLYLNDEHIGYQNKIETTKKVMALIRIANKCSTEIIWKKRASK